MITLYSATVPVAFDKIENCFDKGRKPSISGKSWPSPEQSVPLNKIHALQLIGEYYQSGRSSIHSYELNLVLNNGSRVNVIQHGVKLKLLSDAQLLSSFLAIPVWNAIG